MKNTVKMIFLFGKIFVFPKMARNPKKDSCRACSSCLRLPSRHPPSHRLQRTHTRRGRKPGLATTLNRWGNAKLPCHGRTSQTHDHRPRRNTPFCKHPLSGHASRLCDRQCPIRVSWTHGAIRGQIGTRGLQRSRRMGRTMVFTKISGFGTMVSSTFRWKPRVAKPILCPFHARRTEQTISNTHPAMLMGTKTGF